MHLDKSKGIVLEKGEEKWSFILKAHDCNYEKSLILKLVELTWSSFEKN